GQCHRYSEYAIDPRVTNGVVASSRLGPGSGPCQLAADRMNKMVAPTGTSAHGPGNSLTPSMRTPQDRIAASATVAASARSHFGQRMWGTSEPASAPSSSSHARAKLL